MFGKVSVYLFILQKKEDKSFIPEMSTIFAVISSNVKTAKLKFLSIAKNTSIISNSNYINYEYWTSMPVEDYANHHHRRHSW